jgi:hypothetical protein
MIITESFVWINYPKTASTFVREALRDIYTIRKYDLLQRFRMRSRWMEELLLPENRARVGDRSGAPTPHGTRRQIPVQHRGKPVISAIRCPVNRCLSLYRYGDWKANDQMPALRDEIEGLFPSYPDLSFPSFVEYMMHFYAGIVEIGGNAYKLGPQSVDFLAFFTLHRHHRKNGLVFDTWRELETVLEEVVFLVADDINSQLFALLTRVGFYRCDVQPILLLPRINKSKEPVIESAIDEATFSRIASSEWLLGEWWNRTANGSRRNLEEVAARAVHPGCNGSIALKENVNKPVK